MDSDVPNTPPAPPAPATDLAKAVKRALATGGVLLALGTCVAGSAWRSVMHYVPAGKVLVVVTKMGDPLLPGQLLAKPGQKGIQEEVLGEGRHFILPVVNEVELASAIEIGTGEVGVVRANVGEDLPSGKILADENEKGIRRRVLPPGRHRLNPHGYTVEKQLLKGRSTT